MERGRLRVYLGAAPGVGKTYAMLEEGQRVKAGGADVVVGLLESHGRRLTAKMAEGLEVVPRRTVIYRGRPFTEMDTEAVLARRPQVALVDELAHTNVPGAGKEKRWQDVERILDAGVDVVTTVNIQHLESLKDVVEQITGIRQSETIPDEVVRRADQIELVDLTPEALRRRMVQGYIYPADRVDVALTHYFRPGNLTALRELALLWLADRVEEGLQRYRVEHGIATPWETKERIVVALSGDAAEQALIRRAARIADRTPGSELLAVHVIRTDDAPGADPAVLAGQRALVESLGGFYHQVVGADVAAAILQFARAEDATQLVLGGAGRGRLAALLLGDRVVDKATRMAGAIDVHVLPHKRKTRAPTLTLPSLTRGLGSARFRWGVTLAALLVPGLTLALVWLPGPGLAGVLLLYLLAVVTVALVGGLYPALVAAVGAGVLADYYFVPPMGSLAIGRPANAAVLAVFVVVASIVSGAVERAARRSRTAARSSVEAATLSDLAIGALRGGNDLPALLERVRVTFGLDSVSLLESDGAGGHRWFVVASSGSMPPERPEDADTEAAIGGTLVLAGHGRSLDAGDRRVFAACAALVAASLEERRSERRAEEHLADRRRTDLLRTVAGDLEPELAVARHAVEGLRDRTAPRTEDEWDELCAQAEGAVERVHGLVADLVDVSRLNGALDVFLRPVDVGDVLIVAVDDLGPGGHDLVLRLPQELPNVIADAVLLTRLVTYLAADALRRSSADAARLHIEAAQVDGRVEIRLVDHTAPVPRMWERDADGRPVGIVPRVCADLARAIGGVLRWEEIAGGGCTAVLSLPAAASRAPAAPDVARPGRSGGGGYAGA
ncbi:DUF4118 domain-containing protein [Microtetraspora malaysiensis]|uniref:DUF4118 domain-containing protein n=1 Tax=Microtetraspora malaysiensis TaxID=161358 RepID=UPI00082FFB7B|nr:DUF4118 domain-containing protein [Microtetraspora malaysiensis]